MGVLHSPHPWNSSNLDVFQNQNQKWITYLMASSNSYVTSMGPKCFHYMFTYSMDQFQRNVTLPSRMCNGSIWNSPSGSTYITFNDHMVRIMNIFLMQTNMQNIMRYSVSKQYKSICN